MRSRSAELARTRRRLATGIEADARGQENLFRDPESRRVVPCTSKMAFKEITANGTRAGQNREILEFLRTTGKAFTSFEIAKALGVDRSGPGRRMSDLEVAGLVRRRPIRPCQITGRPSITWEAI